MTIRYKKLIALFILLFVMWGFTGAALLASENISSLVVVLIWTPILASFFMSARAAFSRKLILEADRIGWHNGWRRGVKWYPRGDVVAAYEIDHRRDARLTPAVRPFRGYGIVLTNPQANKSLFWFVTHSTTLSKDALTRLREVISPADSATILVIYWPTLKDREQIPILMNYIHGSQPRLIQ